MLAGVLKTHAQFVTRVDALALGLISNAAVYCVPIPVVMVALLRQSSVMPFVEGITTCAVQVTEQALLGVCTVSPLEAELIAACTSAAEQLAAVMFAA